MQTPAAADVETTKTRIVSAENHGKLIRAHINAGERDIRKAGDHFRSAGLLLAQYKAQAKDMSITWPVFLEKYCEIKVRRANELIAIGDGRATLEGIRAATRERVEKHRALRNAQSKAELAAPTSDNVVGDTDAAPTTAEAETRLGWLIRIQAEFDRAPPSWRDAFFSASKEIEELRAKLAERDAEIERMRSRSDDAQSSQSVAPTAIVATATPPEPIPTGAGPVDDIPLFIQRDHKPVHQGRPAHISNGYSPNPKRKAA